jgi:hypothetical protein
MTSKPMCPNPVWCAGVGDERHRAQFRHQCPFGKSCQDHANPKHLEEFAHDKFYTETRTVNPASPMINPHPSSNGAGYAGAGGPIAQGVVVQQPQPHQQQQFTQGASNNNSFTVTTSQGAQPNSDGKGAAPMPYPTASSAMPAPMMMGPYPTHGMWMPPTASPYPPAPVSLMPGAFSSPIYPTSQAPSTAMAMPYTVAPAPAAGYSGSTSQGPTSAQPPYPGFFLSKNIPAPAGSSQMNRPKPAS